jgi:hypothetical protein
MQILRKSNLLLFVAGILITGYAKGQCYDDTTHTYYWSAVVRAATNDVVPWADSQVVGDYWFDWEVGVSAVVKVGSTVINSDSASVGYGGNNTSGFLNLSDTGVDLYWEDAPSVYGAGTYTITSSHTYTSACSDYETYDYSGAAQQTLVVYAPTVDGLSGIWWLGGGSDPTNGYYNEGLLTANAHCGDDDICTDTPSWTITTGGDKMSLSCMSCSNTTTTSLGASYGLGDISIQISIGGFQADAFPYTINAPAYLTSVYPYLYDTTDSDGFYSYIFWANVDILGDEMTSIALNEQFGSFSPDQANNWPAPTAGSVDSYAGYVWADHVYVSCPACAPAPANPAGPPPTGSAVMHASQTWFVGSSTGSVGVCVQVDTIQYYTDHGRDNSPGRCS